MKYSISIGLDINEDRESFMQVLEELTPLNQLEFDVDVMKITYDDLPEIITPETIAKIGVSYNVTL